MTDNRGKFTRSGIDHYTKIIGVPLQKGIQQGDGSLLVTGFFTSDAKDEIGDIITRGATERAVPKYRQWGNIRYMHQPRPVGKVTRIGTEDGLRWNEVEIRVIDPEAVFQVEEGLLAALSVGIYFTWDDFEILEDGGWLINDYSLAEISLVDHPANYDAVLSNMKGLVFDMARTKGKDAALSYLDELRDDIALEDGNLTANLETNANLNTNLEEGIVIEIASEEDEGSDEESIVEPVDDLEDADKSVVPYSDTGTADKEQSWSKPSLGDFTEESWENLSASERRRIAKHYTWSANMPPDTFGDLKLPHHNASREGVGEAVWRGVAAAYSRLHQENTQIPDSDIGGCESHLEKHYAQFDEEPPEKAIPVSDELSDDDESETLDPIPAVGEIFTEPVPDIGAQCDVQPDVEPVENTVPAGDIEAEGIVTTAELEIDINPDADLFATVQALRLEFDGLRADVKTLAEALLAQEQSKGEGPNVELEEVQAEVARLTAEVESIKAERDSLQKELDELRLPAGRLGGIPETELPDEKDAEVVEEEGLKDQPSLKRSIRNFLEQRYPTP